MKIIGIDYGEKKTGIAFADGPLAEPIEVLYHQNMKMCIFKVCGVLKKFDPEIIIVGMPAGAQAENVREFIHILSKEAEIPIETIDERRSTLEAQYLSREGGVSRKKRRKMEDAFSASIILQKYLDSML